MFISVIFPNWKRRSLTVSRQDYFKLELNQIRKNKCLWPVKILTFVFRGLILHVQKSSKQQNMKIHMIIIAITSRTCSTSSF